MKYCLVLLSLFPAVALASFDLVSNAPHPRVNDLLREVKETLPLSLREAIGKKITVNFQKLDVDDKIIWGRVIQPPFRKAQASQVDLNEKLLREIDRDERYQLAKSTLIHEISHIYDFQNKLVGAEKELKLTKKSYTISDSPLFWNISGWQKKSLTRRMVQTNQRQTRRVDVYEDKNPQETFAVNMEHFLQDPEFKCRKPSLYDYLSQALEHEPFPGKDCDLEYRIAPTVNFEGNLEAQKIIDPSRLYEVHYFFAGQGKEIMSRWGHAMLRLVMCAPHRTEVNEKCLQDRNYHLVLSFRADVTNFNIDYIKGLTGKYASKMFVLSIADVVKEYTIGELRDLHSIPLRMTPEQKNQFVTQVLDRYWNYEGKYYFITNNCADETLSLLKSVYLDDLKLVDLSVMTPLGMKEKFESLGLVDMSVFDDPEDAKKKGYLFESVASKLERIFSELVQKKVLPQKASKFEAYLNTSSLTDRQKLLESTDQKDLGKLLFIEDTILNRKIIALQKKMGKALDDEDRGRGGKFLTAYKSIETLRQKKVGLELSRGYGIPQTADDIFPEPEFTEQDEEELKSAQKALSQEIERLFGKEQNELLDIAQHKYQILRNMNQRTDK
jgi:hypothetical protein